MLAAVHRGLLFIAASFAAAPAAAEETRDLCADRPGLGTPACTVAPGTVVGEIGIADWTRDSDRLSRTDTVLAGDTLLRIGLTESLEAQLGWTALGHVRIRDKVTATSREVSRVGDVTVALRQNLRNPDGSGFAIAVMAYASLPAGRTPIGASDWGVGLLVPFSFDLSDTMSIAFTPQIDAAIDDDGNGRHLGFGNVAGLGFALGDGLSASTELSLYRNRDPAGHSTQALAGLSAGWQPDEATQFDIGVNVGLNPDSPDRQLYFGVARRF